MSLTAVPCKVLASLNRDKVLDHLTEQGMLSEHQHGFRPKRSCSTQRLEVLDAWTNKLEDANPVDVVYLDFRKMSSILTYLDSVPHLRLLNKLQSYGVTGKLPDWIKTFLTGRKQQVILEVCHVD